MANGKFSPEVIEALVSSRASGASDTYAAKCAGISRPTLYSWLRLGERGVEPFAAFAESYETAYQEYAQHHAACLAAAMRPATRQVA